MLMNAALVKENVPETAKIFPDLSDVCAVADIGPPFMAKVVKTLMNVSTALVDWDKLAPTIGEVFSADVLGMTLPSPVLGQKTGFCFNKQGDVWETFNICRISSS